MSKPIDTSKKSNIKCEHCKHFDTHGKTVYDPVNCKITGEQKHYWNRCKHFEWGDPE